MNRSFKENGVAIFVGNLIGGLFSNLDPLGQRLRGIIGSVCFPVIDRRIVHKRANANAVDLINRIQIDLEPSAAIRIGASGTRLFEGIFHRHGVTAVAGSPVIIACFVTNETVSKFGHLVSRRLSVGFDDARFVARDDIRTIFGSNPRICLKYVICCNRDGKCENHYQRQSRCQNSSHVFHNSSP